MHNLGSQIRVTWTQDEPSTATTTLGKFYGQPNATGSIFAPGSTESLGLAETVLQVTPLQFHFHTTSEHTVEGKFSALELHLVTNVTGANTSCANNCTAVFGVLYDFSPDGIAGKAFKMASCRQCLMCIETVCACLAIGLQADVSIA